MTWEDVGNWLKRNAGHGAALVGALLTGNVPAAVAAGAAMASTAAGSDDPGEVLARLQQDPQTVVRLREIAQQEQESIRQHIEAMERMKLEDAQAQHRTTQATIQAGDRAEDPFVRRTRPGQSWLSLFAALAYVFGVTFVKNGTPDLYVLAALLTLPWAYAGLRQVGKGVESLAGVLAARGAGRGQ